MRAFLGGISENYDSNYISLGNEITVVEADEYDRSFLRLHPDMICITAIDPDHLDTYQSGYSVEESFMEFSRKVEPQNLFVNENLSLEGNAFGFSKTSDIRIEDLRIEGLKSIFNMVTPAYTIKGLEFFMPGVHNAVNALTAVAVCLKLGVSPDSIRESLSTFRGVKRRFSYQINHPEFVFIDDYAHHPKEIDAVYDSICGIFPKKENLVIFQPHLFTRTRDFADAFADSLSRFDNVALLNIYPAREEPIEGIDSQFILEKISHIRKKLIAKDEMCSHVRQVNPKVLITLGAGDIGDEVGKLKKLLS
ncbi:UDP-N-acetylmuramate--L-alanine ligase [Elysia marginata]|uniref:UDP-N-acetylmuramate--L-alanine ligase n=1 Tax=Elysia marginata TaxID=1093978 RepID=A0AAV4F212_9GAST|nr:UDP-N-acetylmuramate--L-alanine ligase [Elysia marginata]